jgi:hypothetical protein
MSCFEGKPTNVAHETHECFPASGCMSEVQQYRLSARFPQGGSRRFFKLFSCDRLAPAKMLGLGNLSAEGQSPTILSYRLAGPFLAQAALATPVEHALRASPRLDALHA